MNAFLYGLGLQWKLDIRSKAMLITCYLLPLIFFAFMGGIFTSINPQSRQTLIQSMSIFGVSMGALVGLPPSLVEIYSSDIKKVYKANGIPLLLGVVIHFISAFIHLFIMCTIIFVVAPITFNATIPANIPVYLVSLVIYIATSLSIGSVFGLVMKNIPKLTMVSQIVFMPSIMLSGIMFSTDMLPQSLEHVGKIFPATWAYRTMTGKEFDLVLYIPMIVVFVITVLISVFAMSKKTNG
ncbi:ABC transporter permease [Clostridiaceae bacterium M8S5]|nr:ABC transporter permease [Clostridiaceae bacterium M8S5]